MRFALATMLGLLFVSDILVSEADAFPWRRARRSNYSTNYNYYNTNYTYSNGYSNTSWGGNPQSTAASKAQTAANGMIKGHLGGGYGGANAEGVGFSTYSAQHALNSCCFTGQRTVAGSAVVRGADGWYAVKLYW